MQLENKKYIKIIRVKPINYNLKSNLEKESILNSYRILFKTCKFDFQILIQSNKEDLSKHFSKIEKISKSEEKNIQKISQKYIEFIKRLNNEKRSSSKNYFIILKYEDKNNEVEDLENYAIENLNNNYFKIKDSLSRCGNVVEEIKEEEIIEILFSFFNTRIYLNN